MLFDPGSTYINISTPIGKFFIDTHVYCFVLFCLCFLTMEDLVILDMTDFDIILGITWLSPYYVVHNGNPKFVNLEIP